MPTNNFIQFNSSKNNMMNDESYTQQAPQGIVGGGTIADSTLHNKLFYQLSTFIKAFSQFMNDEGFDSSDNDINDLKQNITNALQSLTNTAISNIQASPAGANVQFQVPELGIVGLIGYNGYINFGKRFNNFLLQWGNINVSTIVNYTNGIPDNVQDETPLPLATTETYVATATHRGDGLTMCIVSRLDNTGIGIRMGIYGYEVGSLPWSARYIVISRI